MPASSRHFETAQGDTNGTLLFPFQGMYATIFGYPESGLLECWRVFISLHAPSQLLSSRLTPLGKRPALRFGWWVVQRGVLDPEEDGEE